jgi:hypothetical protein
MKHYLNIQLAEGYNCQPCKTELGVENRAIVVLEDYEEVDSKNHQFADFHPLCATHANVRIPVGTPILGEDTPF